MACLQHSGEQRHAVDGAQFTRVESKTSVADSVSRGDLSMAAREDWIRLDRHTDAITDILTRAASDIDYATNQAVYNLENATN